MKIVDYSTLNYPGSPYYITKPLYISEVLKARLALPHAKKRIYSTHWRYSKTLLCVWHKKIQIVCFLFDLQQSVTSINSQFLFTTIFTVCCSIWTQKKQKFILFINALKSYSKVKHCLNCCLNQGLGPADK
jgi:hypothetical protein